MQSSVRCAHILLKHTGSRNPVDRFRNKKVTRSLDEASAGISEIRKNVEKDLSKFADYALQFSECSSAQNGGDLGFFNRGDMQKEFEDVSFSLKVGELSQAVSTDSGIHIILRLN